LHKLKSSILPHDSRPVSSEVSKNLGPHLKVIFMTLEITKKFKFGLSRA